MSHYINIIKYYIEQDDIDAIKNLIYEMVEENENKEYRINFEYIWQKCYLHACLKKKTHIKYLFNQIYDGFPEVTKAALKPTLIYGKYL